ncbi:hypothetical protein G6K93_31295 [Agrobacterium rhizogenes]|uniref:N-terminal domain of galactosyltransferase family protein n=1 Tax=Rhizobium rhizogenes TaxID=359 RepID=A0A7S4ZU09_RHIRH|nr:galactosyltransferase-related protein [Rhizobium rhizogenes]NTF59387.1 hypothetical protein [Rhizobium rhizogenes]NTF78972.1 hypothetical protein [Rhizobium rhizogenes]NTJ51501.1 hypothetical protein [Rhizobium rhizogenes]QCL10259.1 N-terminal domain of galactosyltransferase family protein [Rhizobium rhizogenes]
MFAQNADCKFDTELALISSTITHADPYSKLVNPKRWLENRDLHARAFTAMHHSTNVPEYIKYQFHREGPVDYNLLYSLIRGPHIAFLAALDLQQKASINNIAADVAEKSTQLFCRQSFDRRNPELSEASDSTVPLAVVIPFRAATPSDGRLLNLRQALQKLSEAKVRFPNLNVMVVESDSNGRHEEMIKSTGALYRYHQDTGPFNKSAAINLGYRSLPNKPQLLCILDSDAYLDQAFIDICLTAMLSRSARALMPFRDMFFLDVQCSALLRSRSVEDMGTLTGYLTRNSPGGCIWVTSDIFEHVGGFDEGFAGWGGEDRDFYNKVAALVPIIRLPGVFLHLFHERAPEIHAWAQNVGSWQNNYSTQEDARSPASRPIAVTEQISIVAKDF